LFHLKTIFAISVKTDLIDQFISNRRCFSYILL